MDWTEWLLSTLRFSAPLILVAMGGLLSERSGVINIALEGFILFGAFAAATGAHLLGDPWLGLACGAGVGLVVGSFYGVLTVGLRSDQIVAGTAINMLAWGSIPFAGKIMFDSTSNTPSLDVLNRLPAWSPMVLALIASLLVLVGLKHSYFGLWLTFAGEKPEALAAVGVRTSSVRFVAVSLAGMLAALGGGVLSTALSSSYTRNMSAGRGFMALAALILGKWKPIPTAFACILFGFCEVLQLRLQGTFISIAGFTGEVPVQIVQVVPYLFTLFLVAGFVGESIAPKALGQPLKDA